jgi:hypothetical protein
VTLAVSEVALLSPPERSRLGELEGVIARGVASFMEMGAALAEVRDSKLYRADFPTFEAYCRERWMITPQHAHRLLAASAAVQRLEPVGSKPTAESQVRPLLKLQPAQQGVAWEAAVASAKEEGAERPTARHVTAAVRQIIGTAEPEDEKPDTAKPVKGVGLLRANEAINALSGIPKDDPFRQRGFQMVSDWIKHNR